ncbi:hypothetical protein [Flavobacterium sp. FlaQc-48]|uniref:hypothetical protein n=1 Tax=Flavobacterium sp. FlaQc-48 TaxID=3374181 RepID=UPI0037573A16
MNKYLKYLLSLFLAFSLIVNDCTVDFQSKSADYYQSSYVILRREFDFSDSRFYIFKQLKSLVKTSFLIPVVYLQSKVIFSFQIQVLVNLQKLLYQDLASFIRGSVFVKQVINSSNFKTSLYIA